jgi:hypothetical protein
MTIFEINETTDHLRSAADGYGYGLRHACNGICGSGGNI